MNVLIVDDEQLARQRLRRLLSDNGSYKIIGEAETGEDALRKTQLSHPDVILMDISMPEMDGIEATRNIKASYPEIIVLMLTSFSDRDHILPAIEAGAAGYQLKDIEPDELVESLRSLMRGENTLHPKASSELAKAPEAPPPHILHPLTPREAEVLAELTKGKSNREVASALFVTEKTVKTHISNIFNKLEFQDRKQAVLYEVKHGLTKYVN